MDLSALITQLGAMFIFIIIGVIANKTGIITDSGHKTLSKIVLVICQPAMFLSSAMNSQLPYSNLDILKFFGLSWVFYAILLALAYILVPLIRAPKESRGLYRFMVTFGNVAFMGYPIIASMLGNDMVFIAAIFGIPFNILVYSVGIFMVSPQSVEGSKISPKAILNPAFIATLLSLVIFLTRLQFPGFIYQSVKSLGEMITPASMLVIGASLGSMRLKEVFGDFRTYIVSLFKLIVAPVVIWALARLVVDDPAFISMLTITAAMPVAVSSTMVAIQYGGDEGATSRGVFVSTLMSLVTLPCISYFLLV